jgi:hypothetical protein
VALSLKGRALLASGEVDAACRASQAAVDLLQEPGVGEGDEAWVHYHHARALTARGRAGEAATHLLAARSLIEARAAGIADPALRQSFLEDVPVNRAVLEASRP